MKANCKRLGKIEAEFGTVLFNMGLTQMMTQGIEESQKMTEEEIRRFVENETRRQKENGGIYLMTPEFLGDIFRAAHKISECSLHDEIIPYIKMYLCSMPNAREITFYKNDMDLYTWQHLIREFDLEDEYYDEDDNLIENKPITLMAYVTE